MPNTASAKKRVRQTAKRKAINTWRKKQIRGQVKVFLEAVRKQDVAEAETEFRKTAGLLDKIACTSTIHRNFAARRKSRLARRLNDLKKGVAAA